MTDIVSGLSPFTMSYAMYIGFTCLKDCKISTIEVLWQLITPHSISVTGCKVTYPGTQSKFKKWVCEGWFCVYLVWKYLHQVPLLKHYVINIMIFNQSMWDSHVVGCDMEYWTCNLYTSNTWNACLHMTICIPYMLYPWLLGIKVNRGLLSYVGSTLTQMYTMRQAELW